MNENTSKAVHRYFEAQAELQEAVAGEDVDKIASAEKANVEARQIAMDALKSDKPKEIPKPLAERVSLKRYAEIAVGEEKYDGAEAELNRELELGNNHIPWEVLFGDYFERADVATNIDDTVEIQSRPIGQQVFMPGIVSRIGMARHQLNAGETRFAWISTGATAADRQRGQAQDASALAISTEDVEPVRFTSRLLYNTESIAQVGSNLESVLRENVALTLQDDLEDAVLNLNRSAHAASNTPAFTGILSRLSASVDNTENDDTKATIDDWVNMLAGFDDDKEFPGTSRMRLVVGPKTLAAMLTTRDSSSAVWMPVSKLLREEFGVQIIKTGHLPAQTDANGTHGAEQTGLVIGRPENIVMVNWRGVESIYDPYTNSAKGQKALTLHAMSNIAYPNSAAGEIFGARKFAAINSDKT